MVKISLSIKASLGCISELKPSGNDFRWCLKLRCSNCGESSDKWNYLSLSEEVSLPHGQVHLTIKCKLCSRVNSVTIISDSIKSYLEEDQDKFKSIVTFDCRGVEPSDFSAREGWTAYTTDDGKIFQDVDLSEGEWSDYCDKTNQPVMIDEIEHKFDRIK